MVLRRRRREKKFPAQACNKGEGEGSRPEPGKL